MILVYVNNLNHNREPDLTMIVGCVQISISNLKALEMNLLDDSNEYFHALSRDCGNKCLTF